MATPGHVLLEADLNSLFENWYYLLSLCRLYIVWLRLCLENKNKIQSFWRIYQNRCSSRWTSRPFSSCFMSICNPLGSGRPAYVSSHTFSSLVWGTLFFFHFCSFSSHLVLRPLGFPLLNPDPPLLFNQRADFLHPGRSSSAILPLFLRLLTYYQLPCPFKNFSAGHTARSLPTNFPTISFPTGFAS